MSNYTQPQHTTYAYTAQRLLAHSHYGVLQVKPTASAQEIRQAYRELSKLYHPDTTRLSASSAKEAFQCLHEAYLVLSNPDSRQAYDRQIQAGLPLASQTSVSSPSVRSSPVRSSSAYLDARDRPLSPGEVFALFTLASALALCLALAILVGILRGDTPTYSAAISHQLFPPSSRVSASRSLPNSQAPSPYSQPLTTHPGKVTNPTTPMTTNNL